MFDVAVIGGSFAGLTAALQLGRASRSVLVIDAGAPRNRTSPGAHGAAGWDGRPPAEILARFRADLAAYPTVALRAGTAEDVSGGPDGFEVRLAGGDRVAARRILLAHGQRDVLPPIPGVAEAWGRRVLHCPYCHGYEVKGAPLAVLALHPTAAHQALMLRADWSDRVRLYGAGLEGLNIAALEAAGVLADPRGVEAVRADDTGADLFLTGGGTARVGALFLAPRTTLEGSPAARLGCAADEGPVGPFLRVGPMGQTSLPGVFAAGDLARPMPNINFALADGAQSGVACHASLLFPGFVPPLEIAA
ncbi:MAG: pyridine nucleotide-disulfide oxidoreductase [Rhodobacteraceae bacterium]|nr:pyridine nucleotide-disulfide oxidoreductase [Paracoccaceae bacterium]